MAEVQHGGADRNRRSVGRSNASQNRARSELSVRHRDRSGKRSSPQFCLARTLDVVGPNAVECPRTCWKAHSLSSRKRSDFDRREPAPDVAFRLSAAPALFPRQHHGDCDMLGS